MYMKSVRKTFYFDFLESSLICYLQFIKANNQLEEAVHLENSFSWEAKVSIFELQIDHAMLEFDYL